MNPYAVCLPACLRSRLLLLFGQSPNPPSATSAYDACFWLRLRCLLQAAAAATEEGSDHKGLSKQAGYDIFQAIEEGNLEGVCLMCSISPQNVNAMGKVPLESRSLLLSVLLDRRD